MGTEAEWVLGGEKETVPGCIVKVNLKNPVSKEKIGDENKHSKSASDLHIRTHR